MKSKIFILFILLLPTLTLAKPKNKTFNNVNVLGTLYARNARIKNAIITEDLIVNGKIISFGGSNLGLGNVTTQGTTTPDAVARFADSTGTLLKNSAVLIDDSGNITINGITKNGNTVSWPTIVGAANTFLASDGAGNLIYATPAGGGNVSTALPFTTNNAIITADIPSGVDNIKQSPVTLDGSNNIAGVNILSANTVNATTFNGALNGNATSATTAVSSTNFTGPLMGDVTGNQSSTIVSTVGGQTAASVAAGTVLANNSTSANSAGQIVRRDGSGNFSAGTITANLTGNVSGNATSATNATNFTGPLVGDVTGTQGATVVSTVGGQTAANVAAATIAANAATNANTPNTIVKRDGSGNFSAGTITANLSGNATTATTATSATTAGSATNFTGSLAGDVTGTQGATVVSFVGGQTAANVASGAVAANAATNTNTINTIVKRDGSGNFSANMITAALTGNVTGNLFGNATTATTATNATNFSGSLSGDVTGNQSSTVVSTVGGQTAANVASGTILANNSTSANSAGQIVRRDGSGNFSAGTITANLIGNVTGNVTGNLSGNATTATSATSATTATNFTGALVGDVTGTQGATVVSTVGGQSAANVANATIAANAATSSDMPNTIVLRDGSGNFATNMVTLDGAVTNPNDAATKSYVDNAVSTGFTVHPPAVVVSTTNITIAGTQTIDGVALNVNDRVLLVGQTSAIENGLWLVQAGAWTRPADFATGTAAGTAYVLITSGTVYAGTSWVCTTPTAIIDTDPIEFAQFSTQGSVTAANVGTGVGQIFRDKTGNTINLKTLAAGQDIIITNNANDINIATNGTPLNTPSTLVQRDGSGNFAAGTITAALTGAASLNVLKAGDTMTGNLNMALQSQVRFQDSSGSGNYVGLNAPAVVSASYDVNLPASAPLAGQFLQATSPTALQWASSGGTPVVSRTYYVSKSGSDSNDGSFGAPFLTVSHAVSVANTVSTLANPVVISVGAGVFIENNSGGPITITANGISIIGESVTGTVVQPSTLATDLFSISTANVEFFNFTISAGGPGSTANGINLSTSVTGRGAFHSLRVLLFQTGLNLNSSALPAPIIILENLITAGNTTGISSNNVQTVIENSVFLGAVSGSTPANTALSISGTNGAATIYSNTFRLLTTGISIGGGALVRILGSNFTATTNSIVATGASNSSVVGSTFVLNNSSSINIAASGAGTNINVVGCNFQCADATNTSQGTAIQATTGSTILANSSTIENAVVGIQCGTSGDTITTVIRADSTVTINCTTDIQQAGSSLLRFIAGVFDSNKITIANPTNVNFSAFDRTNSDTLAFGSESDTTTPLYEVLNGQPSLPNLTYQPSYYGSKGTVYQNPNADPTFNATQAASNNANYYVVTGDRTKVAGINLFSDTGTPIGTGNNIRGWEISKLGTSASLAFTYTNNDSSGQALRGANTVMLLDGFNNQVDFPMATNAPFPTNTVAQLVWAGDTNLYRLASNSLKTDGNFSVGALNTAGVVHNDNTGLLSTSLIVNADISNSAAITDNKLATISTAGKVANSATTATSLNTPNTIVLRDGSGNFAANTITAALIGAASLNVLKSGDTMTGNLNMALQSQVRFQDSTGSGNYVGLNAPATVSASYDVNLPAAAPTAGQVLQATSPSALQWATVGGAPALAKTYYVAVDGSDSNDGSFAAPFLTVSHAVSVANSVANLGNPIAISIGAGIFVENNSGGPITITSDGISIIGSSLASTIIIPTTPSNNLFNISTPNISMTTLTFDGGGGSTASAININTNASGSPRFTQIAMSQFQTGFSLNTSSGAPVALFDNLEMGGNSVNISITNFQAVVKNSLFSGPVVNGSGATNTGMMITGTTAQIAVLSSVLKEFSTAISITGGSSLRVLASDIESTTNGIVAAGGSDVSIVGANFLLNNPSSVNIACSGAGTTVVIEGSLFKCDDALNNPQGVALQVTNAGTIVASSSTIENTVTGIICGTSGDTNTTSMRADSIVIINCTTDIQQVGTSLLEFVSGVFDSNKLNIANATNVHITAFDRTNGDTLAFGSTSDNSQNLYEILNGQPTLQTLAYQPSYYGSKGTVYQNPNADPTFNATQAASNNANYYVVTGDRTKVAGINLFSDTGSPIGTGNNIRGWEISKLGTSASLAFTYTNNDTSGQAARGPNTVMLLDGFNNQVDFPLATNGPLPTNSVAPLVWAGDTNLYRLASNSLKTDGNFSVGALNTAGVVHNDATGLLLTSLIVNADISNSAAITDNKLATISTAGKVANSATTATSSDTPNTIVLRDGSGNFATNMVTLDGTVTNPTDAATKSYVDNAVSTGFTVHPPAVVVSTTNVVIAGTQTIDGVALVANNRVLLTGQTLPVQNGLWLVQAGAWTRPADFATGTEAGTAYVLITSGTVYAGTSWVCTTPTAIIDTNPITFVQFSTQGSITAANVGTGAGQIFRDKTGNTLNFKTLAAGQDIIITNNTNDVNIATNGTPLNTPSTLVQRDGSGNFAAGTITASLIGNASTATSATNFSGSLAGDVTGTQGATVVSFVGGQTAANVASGAVAANAATNTNTINTIVKRDGSGNFSAGTITANLIGNVTGNLSGNATTATSATTATNFSGSLSGDVTGNQSSTVVSSVGGQTAASVASATVAANAATSSNTPGTIVKRDGSGNFSAGTITANLNGNATSATTATNSTNFTGPLAGDVTGTQGATVVSFVGGQTAANVASGSVAANAATSANTINTIVKRDGSGNFSANMITATLLGNATSATTATSAGSATNFTGSLVGDVTGTQGATVVSFVGGQTAANVASGAVAANAATNTNTANTIVKRDASGNFSAGTITANLIGNVTGNLSGNATTATSATTATNFTGSLAGDVTGTQGATVVSSVGGQTAANVAAATIAANAATSANTPGTIVKRDGSGNFSAGTITASLIGNVTGSASLDVLKAGDTMTGTLTMPAGSAASPSIQFTGSTNTGFSAATANTLSFDTSGVERMNISSAGATVIAALVLNNILAINGVALQVVVPVTNGTVTTLSTTNVLLLQPAANVTNVTINFPPNPINGQLFTITDGSANNITLINAGGTGGAAIVNPVTNLNNGPLNDTNGGVSVTYFYNTTANTWYRLARG